MKIVALCRLLRLLLLPCAVLQVLYFVLAWSDLTPQFGPVVMHFSARGMEGHPLQDLSVQQWLAGALLSLPAVCAMLYGLWRLDRLLAAMIRTATPRTIFSFDNISRLQGFAGGLALSGLLGIVELPVRGLLFSILPGSRGQKISFSVNSEEFILLLVCLVFYLLAGMMHEGRKLAEENEGFI